MGALTERQRQLFDIIVSHIDTHGYPPSQRDMALYLGVSSPRAVAKHLEALERKGYLSRDRVSRGIRVTAESPCYPPQEDCLISSGERTSVSLPVVGTVRAGHLAPAIEDIQGHFSVDRDAARGDGCFFLRVSGDSMISAGIFDGDLALVRPQPVSRKRDIVVAMVDGEATLKRFYKERDHIRLQPANPNMAPIIIRPGDGEVRIVGKVIGIYRRLE
jgi:repressor LexA